MKPRRHAPLGLRIRRVLPPAFFLLLFVWQFLPLVYLQRIGLAVGFGNGNTPLTQASGTTLSGAQTVSAGANLAAIVLVTWNDLNEGINVLTATYNGVALTSLGARVRVNVSSFYLQAFQLAGPAAGSNTLSITFDSPNAIQQGAVLNAYTGVDQTTPVRAGTYTTFTGTTAADGTEALVITSATDDRTFTGEASTEGAPTTSQTLRNNSLIQGSYYMGADDAAGAAIVTHTWDTHVAASNDIALLGASLKAAGAAADLLQGAFLIS